jgi:hypothetical protein
VRSVKRLEVQLPPGGKSGEGYLSNFTGEAPFPEYSTFKDDFIIKYQYTICFERGRIRRYCKRLQHVINGMNYEKKNLLSRSNSLYVYSLGVWLHLTSGRTYL